MRRAGVLAALGLMALLLAPVASAQANPVFRFALDKGLHDEMPLNEDGRRIHEIYVDATVQNFVCAQEAKYAVTVALGEFEKWAGASMNPRTVLFKISQGQPVTTEVKLGQQTVKLEVAWDTESRPDTGARQTYEIKFDTGSFKLDSGGPCAPDPAGKQTFGDPVKITATMEDKTQDPTAQPADCSQAPELPECQTGPPLEAEGNSPGFDVALLALSALVAVAFVGRRK